MLEYVKFLIFITEAKKKTNTDHVCLKLDLILIHEINYTTYIYYIQT